MSRARWKIFLVLGVLSLIAITFPSQSEAVDLLANILVGYPTHFYYNVLLKNLVPGEPTGFQKDFFFFVATFGVIIFEILYLMALSWILEIFYRSLKKLMGR